MAARSKSPAKPDPYPFPFLAHGPWSASDYRQSAEWLVVFQAVVTPEKQRNLLGSVPQPLEQSSWSGDRILTLSTGQDAGVGIWNAYSGQPPLSKEALEAGEFENVRITLSHIKAFCDDVDQWLLMHHELQPIGLVVGATEKEDKWHRWSVKQFADRLLPMFERLFEMVRPVSEKTKENSSMEFGLAHVFAHVLRDYLSSKEPDDSAAEFVQRLVASMERIAGHNDYADYLMEGTRARLLERLQR